MREKLSLLLNNSYAKYSNYRVACICIMKDGKEISGVNVENASFGATICAERVAITSAISKGYSKNDFREIHVMSDGEKLGMPCFMCRQVISEFFPNDAVVYVYTKDLMESYNVEELCPHPFTEDNL